MRIYDVTLPISAGMPVWPGDPVPLVEPVSSIGAGDAASVSSLRLGSHTGTHVDAPSHVLSGAMPVDRLPLEVLIGDVWVCHVPSAIRRIGATTLSAAGIPSGTRRLLLRTANSELWDRAPIGFVTDFVALEPDGAQWIADRGIELAGIDYLSIDPLEAEDLPVHHLLLARGIVVVEGLDLRAVPEGPYWLACLPLRVAGADGAPARVVLVEGH